MGRYEGGRGQKNPISLIQDWQIWIFFFKNTIYVFFKSPFCPLEFRIHQALAYLHVYLHT